jgi:hypothetical protein
MYVNLLRVHRIKIAGADGTAVIRKEKMAYSIIKKQKCALQGRPAVLTLQQYCEKKAHFVCPSEVRA